MAEYVHDMRVANGTVPQGYGNAYEVARDAVTALRAQLHDLQQPGSRANISQRLIMWPDGRDGATSRSRAGESIDVFFLRNQGILLHGTVGGRHNGQWVTWAAMGLCIVAPNSRSHL